jgi:hypothetical protein
MLVSLSFPPCTVVLQLWLRNLTTQVTQRSEKAQSEVNEIKRGPHGRKSPECGYDPSIVMKPSPTDAQSPSCTGNFQQPTNPTSQIPQGNSTDREKLTISKQQLSTNPRHNPTIRHKGRNDVSRRQRRCAIDNSKRRRGPEIPTNHPDYNGKST